MALSCRRSAAWTPSPSMALSCRRSAMRHAKIRSPRSTFVFVHYEFQLRAQCDSVYALKKCGAYRGVDVDVWNPAQRAHKNMMSSRGFMSARARERSIGHAVTTALHAFRAQSTPCAARSPTRRGTRLGRASAQRARRVGWRRSGPRCQRIARGRTSWSGGPDGRATIAACTCPARANTCRTGL